MLDECHKKAIGNGVKKDMALIVFILNIIGAALGTLIMSFI